VLLTGLALGTLCGAGVWFLLLRLGPGGADQAIAWLLGRLSTVGYDEVLALAVAVAAGLALAWRFVPDLDVLLLGEEKAASLGVDVPAAQRGILGAAALLAAGCVAYCGVIAFAGLMVPHVMRGVVGARHARLLPLAALGGAVLLLAIDLASRTIDPPREIPLTILTSLIGAPFFIGVLLRAKSITV
jgi:iron complex transport system permease protein